MYVYFSNVYCDSLLFLFFLISIHSMTVHSCILWNYFVLFFGVRNNKSCYLNRWFVQFTFLDPAFEFVMFSLGLLSLTQRAEGVVQQLRWTEGTAPEMSHGKKNKAEKPK